MENKQSAILPNVQKGMFLFDSKLWQKFAWQQNNMKIYPGMREKKKSLLPTTAKNKKRKKKNKEKNSQLVASSYQLHPSQLQVPRKCFTQNSQSWGLKKAGIAVLYPAMLMGNIHGRASPTLAEAL